MIEYHNKVGAGPVSCMSREITVDLFCTFLVLHTIKQTGVSQLCIRVTSRKRFPLLYTVRGYGGACCFVLVCVLDYALETTIEPIPFLCQLSPFSIFPFPLPSGCPFFLRAALFSSSFIFSLFLLVQMFQSVGSSVFTRFDILIFT